MNSRRLLRCRALVAGFLAAIFVALLSPALADVMRPPLKHGAPVDYDRDVRPILAAACFKCHGFDVKTRQADLRLDVLEGATKLLKSGHRAVVPRHPEQSELMVRITRTGPGAMPPGGTSLSTAQVDVLKRWVAQGAAYAPHWAFVPPKRVELPDKPGGWSRNPIDRFILHRLKKDGLTPSPEADPITLARRVAFDLTGLPPTPAELDRFLSDRQPGAYERFVDRLLASPAYGERMALMWLDVARYADTHGYHIDSHRDMWPWRDWVIDAFNRNLPYDQFVTEQIAGDLLPNATLSQKIATGFNRNHPINFEGGAIPEEYLNAYIVDRVNTTSTVFLGLTMACSQCHDHKYDPLSQRDFYQLYAYFNSNNESGLDGTRGNARPFLKAPKPWQEKTLGELDTRLSGLDAAHREAVATAGRSLGSAAGTDWYGSLRDGMVLEESLDAASDPAGSRLRWTGTPEPVSGVFGTAVRLSGAHADVSDVQPFDRQTAWSVSAWVNPTSAEHGAVVSRMDENQAIRGWDLYLGDYKVYAHLIHAWEGNAIRVNTRQPIKPNQWSHLTLTYDGSGKAAGVKLYVDGKAQELQVTHDSLTGTIAVPEPVRIGRRTRSAPFKGQVDEIRLHTRALTPSEVAGLAGLDRIRALASTPVEALKPDERQLLAHRWLQLTDDGFQKLEAEREAIRREKETLEAAIPTTMVMEELKEPRPTHILVRGQYNQKAEAVTSGVPAVLATSESPLPSRLGLARWLVSRQNPLTARVAVNRFWQMVFGAGLVRTPENFGTQGERPTHPELLDWLAVTFSSPVASDGTRSEAAGLGWDVKALLKMIVTSSTYRQSSHASPSLLKRDPENRLLARGARYRLPAETVRDQALLVSGLLVPSVGGPSVRPYQPPGLWEDLAFGGDFSAQTYVQDHGEKLYRRSMYTFWKRTCPPPSLQTFDAPEREVCLVKRSVTNTPLQALVLMNDPTYIEASRKLAERILTEVAALPIDRARYAVRLTLGRPATGQDLKPLLRVYELQRERFTKDRAAAEKLLKVGESPSRPGLDPVEVASWAAVGMVLFNLDEMITRN